MEESNFGRELRMDANECEFRSTEISASDSVSNKGLSCFLRLRHGRHGPGEVLHRHAARLEDGFPGEGGHVLGYGDFQKVHGVVAQILSRAVGPRLRVAQILAGHLDVRPKWR